MDKILYKMDNSNIENIKKIVFELEEKKDKTDTEKSMLINAKMKIKALQKNEIVTK